jgi:hypothetical protein
VTRPGSTRASVGTWLIRTGGFLEAGRPALAIDSTGQVAAAIRHMLDGKARGKLAVSVSPGRVQTPATGSTP